MSKEKYYYDPETLTYRNVKKRRNKLTQYYRIVFLNEDTFEEKLSFKTSRIKSILFLFSTIIVICLCVFYIYYLLLGKNKNLPPLNVNITPSISILLTIFLTTIIIYILKIIYQYLQESQNKNRDLEKLQTLLKIEKGIHFFLNKTKNKTKTKDEKVNEIITFIKNKIELEIHKKENKEITIDKELLTQDKDINRKLINNFKVKKETIERFEKLISSFTKRSNVNLLLGISITFIAFSIISYTLFNYHTISVDSINIFEYFFPRFLTLTFIQIFAFFFLKNYRTNIKDIKFYQNEITNIELKYLGIFLHSNGKELEKSTIQELIKTERNYLTYDKVIEDNSINGIVSIIKEGIKNYKK